MKPPLKISTAAVPSPAKMPPAIARNVTRMLFVKISLDSAAWSPALSAPGPPPGSAAPWNSGGTTPIAAAGSSIAHTAASASGANSSTSAAASAHGTLQHPAPVAGREEPPHRPARALVGVDGLAPVEDEPLEPPRHRVVRERAAREGEIGGGGAIEAAEAPQPLRPEPLGLGPGARGAAPRARSSQGGAPPRNGLASPDDGV